jgi:hypothetical protein
MAYRRLLLLGVGLSCAASAHAQGQKPLGELYSGEASVRGSVLLRAQATEVLSGSQIAAGEASAVLKLSRGGQLRICPKSNLSLNADARDRSLSLGLDAGAMELDYALDSGADSLLTPDFRLQLISPGSFHLAISVGASGDTCLRTLPGDNAAVFVTEMMGNDVYQLSPGKSVLFREGKISEAAEAPELCGCPEAAPPAKTRETAKAQPEAASPQATPPQAAHAEGALQGPPGEVLLPPGAAAGFSPENSAGSRAQENAPQAAAPPALAHMEVDTHFSYRGDQAAEDFYAEVARLSLSTDNSKLALALLPQISAPAAESAPATPAATAQSGGFLHRFFRHFFGH